ncbi:SWIM zinc finger family protein [Streptomyces sp. NPDC006349]|uniref:SWIM zinc finger family protein n=1 Tax=Streptomyces sp. NPDC006349 TaxID=3156757 RepID=UPI0033A1C9AC
MTPRPADEARRALREARERGEGAPGRAVDATASADADADSVAAPGPAQTDEHGPGRNPEAHTGPRPGDVARAALRSARTARPSEADAPSDADADAGNAVGGAEAHGFAETGTTTAALAVPGTMEAAEAADRPHEVPESVAPPVSDGTAAPAVAEPRDEAADGSVDRTHPHPGSHPHPHPGSHPHPHPGSHPEPQPETPRPGTGSGAGGGAGGDSRPADVAREALRAARRQARADAETKGAGSTRRSPRPAGRPRGTGGSGTADARARAVREFVAGAFRLPPEDDQVEEVPTSEGSPGASPAESRAAARPEPGPSPGPDPAAEAAASPAAPASAGRTPSDEASASAGEPWPWATSSHAPPTSPQPGPRQPAAHGRRPATPPSTPPATPPATPRAPRSMAAPDRDGELRRTFPALPPRAAAEEGLAGTWWGNAWVRALEEGALDAARLERGRGYAERGHVDAITVTPGLVLAYVQGSRARPYRVQVRLRTLGDADWERFLDAAVERPGHIAALLDRELPHSLADLADRGVPLLPGPGDLTPQCSCPDSGHPCKHAAAVCYQTARLLDADPFVLLLLRGRGERELLDALSRLNAARAARAAQDRGPAPLPGVRATEALTRGALPPLPAPQAALPHPEQPPAYPAAPGGPDPFALDQLATDAAARAHALLTTGRDPVGRLTLWQDAVRLAAARPGSGLTAGTRALYASLASAAGRDAAELARAVAAWRQGGPEGLDVLEEPWDPPAGRFDRARPLLLAADLPAFRPWRNHLTHPHGHVQLRLGRAGLWYAYESEPGREDWWPRGTPDLDPVGALTGLGTRDDL